MIITFSKGTCFVSLFWSMFFVNNVDWFSLFYYYCCCCCYFTLSFFVKYTLWTSQVLFVSRLWVHSFYVYKPQKRMEILLPAPKTFIILIMLKALIISYESWSPKLEPVVYLTDFKPISGFLYFKSFVNLLRNDELVRHEKSMCRLLMNSDHILILGNF